MLVFQTLLEGGVASLSCLVLLFIMLCVVESVVVRVFFFLGLLDMLGVVSLGEIKQGVNRPLWVSCLQEGVIFLCLGWFRWN